jgi:Family of unknown function (DUF6325)
MANEASALRTRTADAPSPAPGGVSAALDAFVSPCAIWENPHIGCAAIDDGGVLVVVGWAGYRFNSVGQRRGKRMTDVSLDELGPVDYVVVEFPAGHSNFTGEMAAELLALVNAGTIRVIDILILTKNQDGTVDATEFSDVGELGELQALEAQLAELLTAEDVENLAAAMDPGSTAGVLIWENLWAAPFASAARRSGGEMIANGRIPIQAIIASIEADQAEISEGG